MLDAFKKISPAVVKILSATLLVLGFTFLVFVLFAGPDNEPVNPGDGSYIRGAYAIIFCFWFVVSWIAKVGILLGKKLNRMFFLSLYLFVATIVAGTLVTAQDAMSGEQLPFVLFLADTVFVGWPMFDFANCCAYASKRDSPADVRQEAITN